jgi:predicted GNAT superfamily acetyltransferase
MCLFKKRKNDDGMSNKQAINLLFHIGNNISKIADNDEDAEIYLQAIEKAVNALQDKGAIICIL